MDSDDLKKLSPAERLKKLKEIELEKKKEIEEAQKLLIETADELDEEERKKENMPIPQVAATDEAILFTVEEREVFRLRRFKDTEAKGNSVKTTNSSTEHLSDEQHLDGLEELVVKEKTDEDAQRLAQVPQYNTQQKKDMEHSQQRYQTPATAEESEQDSKYVGMYQRSALEEEKFKVPLEKSNVMHQAEKYLKGTKAKTLREDVEETVKYAR